MSLLSPGRIVQINIVYILLIVEQQFHYNQSDILLHLIWCTYKDASPTFQVVQVSRIFKRVTIWRLRD